MVTGNSSELPARLVFRATDSSCVPLFFFFNDTATTEIYTLSLHDALPISAPQRQPCPAPCKSVIVMTVLRSEEHTSELQSRPQLVCRLLLEKKKKNKI